MKQARRVPEFGPVDDCGSVTLLAVCAHAAESNRTRTEIMPIAIHDLEGNVTKVIISGRVDIVGARELEMPMAVVAGSRRAVVIDLSGVEFMASLGLRGIVVGAKSIFSKRGKVVLLAPRPEVEAVITLTGINQLIPIFHDEEAAIAAVAAPS